MRLSADINDPGYGPSYASAKVFLDDVELHDCVTADEERGEVLVYMRDESNKLRTDPDDPHKILAEWKRGVVKIVLPAA